MKRPNFQRLKQPTPKELTDSLLEFLRRKFYTHPGDEKRFLQDRSRLLRWVVLWPASWLNARGVTIHGDAYRDIFFKVMLQADAHRSERIKYRPAWLKMVLQSHFKIHGEEYYEAAKTTRALVDQTLLMVSQVGQLRVAPEDPIKEMAVARQILNSLKPQKKASEPPVKDQLSLF